MATSNTASSALPDSVFKYIGNSLRSLNAEYPKWQNTPSSDSATICIPAHFETVRRNLESETSATDVSGNRGDATEHKVFNALKRLNIGAIVISNFDMDEFDKKAGVISKRYKASVVEYNKHVSGTTSLKAKFECDFMLFHSRIGICVVEVKAVENGTIPQKALKQVVELPQKIKLLYEAISNESDNNIPIKAIICCPNSSLSEESADENKTYNIIDKASFETDGSFQNFWTKLVDQSEPLECFAAESFQQFIAVVCCYRSAIYLKGIPNAIMVAELIQQQKLFPKATAKKVMEDELRRELFPKPKNGKQTAKVLPKTNAPDANENVIFLTKEQKVAEQCTDRRQLIFGPPGTGKTIVLLLQALKAAQISTSARLFVVSKKSYVPKIRKFFEANKEAIEFVREPIVLECTRKMELAVKSCDDLFLDEIGQGYMYHLKRRITSSGRTVIVISGSEAPSEYSLNKGDLEKFSTIYPGYTSHYMKKVMRGSVNIVDSWKKQWAGGDFEIGHAIEGPDVKPPKMCTSKSEVLQSIFDDVQWLIRKGALPEQIAVITCDNVESPTMDIIRKIFQTQDWSLLSNTVHVQVTNADEQRDDSVVIDNYTKVLSHEWPFVIACSLIPVSNSKLDTTTNRFDYLQSFLLIASSRAIVYLSIVLLNKDDDNSDYNGHVSRVSANEGSTLWNSISRFAAYFY